MFENASQEMFVMSFLVYRALPVLKFIASILMAFSVHRHAKSKNINHKGLWTAFAFVFPILGRLVYCIYHRFVRKTTYDYLFEQTQKRKGNGTVLCMLSLLLYGIIFIVTVVSIATMGFSVVKSVIDDEPLWEVTCYDVKGNKYRELYDVPLYDHEGNTYIYEPAFLTTDYIDQNGNALSGDYCYLDSDGYLVYDDSGALTPCEECWCDYYYDSQGNKYYDLGYGQIYWDENGDIFESRSRSTVQLFEEETDISYTYSREYVEDMCSGWGFGDGSLDDTYVVAQYIYSSEDFEKLYGKNFAIEYISGSAEFESGFRGKQGTSYCRAHIGEDIWAFNLTIDYGEDWQITDYHLEEAGAN